MLTVKEEHGHRCRDQPDVSPVTLVRFPQLQELRSVRHASLAQLELGPRLIAPQHPWFVYLASLARGLRSLGQRQYSPVQTVELAHGPRLLVLSRQIRVSTVKLVSGPPVLEPITHPLVHRVLLAPGHQFLARRPGSFARIARQVRGLPRSGRCLTALAFLVFLVLFLLLKVHRHPMCVLFVLVLSLEPFHVVWLLFPRRLLA